VVSIFNKEFDILFARKNWITMKSCSLNPDKQNYLIFTGKD